ncbi:MAG: hypothetical protein ABJK28_15630 [Algibacter sp.]
MKKSKLNFLALLILGVIFVSNAQSARYVNDMDYVLGDTKQAFITGGITTTAQADNLLIGFKKMGVNGIRIPIFPRDSNGVDVNPNKPMMDYFYTQAVAQGFLIFANPAQGGGGARIANNSLSHEGGVNGVQAATDELIARVLEFSNEYPDCKWINPFNEDGRATNSTWSVAQYHTIYAALYNNVNGAELVGPCTWGLPAAIDMLQNTNIADYITVATSHNLGFNHSSWSTFINLANAENLPVWDSEVNHSDKFGTGTRLEKAIENEVDGLVLYNSWNTISLTNGSISSAAETMMDLYLKFRTDKTYYIDCPALNKRLASTGGSEDAYTTSTSTTGDDVEWEFVEKGNGYFHIQRAAGGSKPRIRTDYTENADMQSIGSNGIQTYFDFTAGYSNGTYHLTLPDISVLNRRRLQVTSGGFVKMVTSSSSGSWVSFTFKEVGSTQSKSSKSKEIEIESETTSKLKFPSMINSLNPNFKPLMLLENRSDYTLNVYSLDGKRVFSTSNMEEAWVPSGRQKGIFVFHATYMDDQNVKSMERGKVVVQ